MKNIKSFCIKATRKHTTNDYKTFIISLQNSSTSGHNSNDLYLSYLHKLLTAISSTSCFTFTPRLIISAFWVMSFTCRSHSHTSYVNVSFRHTAVSTSYSSALYAHYLSLLWCHKCQLRSLQLHSRFYSVVDFTKFLNTDEQSKCVSKAHYRVMNK